MAGMLQADASQLALAAGGTSTISHGRLEEPDHSSSNWYFSREEIENNSPSRKDSIDLKKETYLRKSYCTFLQDLGMRLKVPQVTIATAIVFCHRFFWRQSHHKNDRYMIATTCMFLAGKVEETPKPLRDVILVSYEIRNKKDPAAVQKIKQKEVYEEQKELVLLGERLVLTTLGFDLNIHHPYKPLVAAIKKFKVAQNALAQVAWNFVNDGLRTSLCLQFKPHHIAAGAIFLAAKFLKVKLPSDGEKAWWQEFEVTPRQLEEVSNQMLELYEQNRETPASRLSDPIVSVGGNNRNKGPLAQTSEVSGSLLTREDYSQAQGRHSSVSVQARQINGVIETSKEELRGCVHEGLGKEYLHSGQHPPNGVVRQDILTKNEVKDHQGNAVGFRDSVIKEEQKQMADFWRLRNKSEVSHAVKNEPKDERVSGGAEVDERKESAQLQLLDMQVKEVAEKKLLGEVKTKPGVEDYEQKNPFVGLDEANKDRVKAAMEKRRKSRGEGGDVKLSAIKLEPTDEEELLERELENAVEAAAELERAKQEGKDSRTKVSLRAECEASELKRERIEEGVSKRKRSNEEPYPLVDKKRSRSYEKADSIDREYEKFAEGSLDRTEEGELPATNGQDQLRSPKTEKTQAGASPLKKHDHMGRDQHGRRDSSYDLKYRHGHNRDHHHHHPHYQHPIHRVDTDRERNHHEDWQEKDYKKSRHDHAK